VYGPEGRLSAVYDQHGVSLTHYRAEYWLKDHLGNTRLAFSDENHDGANLWFYCCISKLEFSMKRKSNLFVCLILMPFLLHSQPNGGDKYFLALAYLNNAPIVQIKLKEKFYYLSKRKKCSLQYTIEPKIELLPIYFFQHQLFDSDINIDKKLIEDRDRYQIEYQKLLDNQRLLIPFDVKVQAKIKLTFSPIISNYLIVEFLDTAANIGSIKMGPALQVLFIFNDDDTIQKILYANPVYN